MFDSIFGDLLYIAVGIFILAFLAATQYIKYFVEEEDFPADLLLAYPYGYTCCDGPHSWGGNFPCASGQNQSPICIHSACALVVHLETLRNPLVFSPEYNTPPREAFVINDGHTINFNYKFSNCRPPTLSGGPLEGCYEFYSMNLRWAELDDGTEHMVDNFKHDMEMQLSCVRNGHKNIYTAAEAGDLVMVTYFYEISENKNPFLDELFRPLGECCQPFNKYRVQPVLLSFIAPPFSRGYYSYMGSMTYPPCIEGVRWIIQPVPCYFSYEQWKKVKNTPLMFSDMGYNLRPIQELNGRDVMFVE